MEDYNRQDEKQRNQRIIDSYDYLSNAASTQDCTGLIPSGPTREEELDAYDEIYRFRPPRVPDPDEES